LFHLQLRPLSPEIVQINQDADGIIPEEIAEKCEQRRRDGKPLPKVRQKICSTVLNTLEEILLCS